MCDLPVPCACTLEKRDKIRAAHIERSDALQALAYKLSKAGHVSDQECELILLQAASEWDDAIHIASPTDPLQSLCGHFGRNLTDLPERPDGWSGCWTCLLKADELAGRQNAPPANEPVLAAAQ